MGVAVIQPYKYGSCNIPNLQLVFCSANPVLAFFCGFCGHRRVSMF